MKRYRIPHNKTLISRVTIEVLALFMLIYPMAHIYIVLQGDMFPYKRGFYCDDESLKHPDIEEEISVGHCFIIWACIVILIVPAVEIIHVLVFQHGENEKVGKIPWIIIELYRILGYFTLGAMFTLLTTEMAKYKIGRLRPYFLTVCNIELTEELCMDETGKYHKFVTDYNCPGDDKEVREASKSFLSGHSSFSFYCATFLIVYLHARLKRLSLSYDNVQTPYRKLKIAFKGLKIIRPFFQFGIFMLALYICLTRISDYKHHPGDVIAGMFVGLFFATLILIFMMDLFHRERTFKYESCMEIDFIDNGNGRQEPIQLEETRNNAIFKHEEQV